MVGSFVRSEVFNAFSGSGFVEDFLNVVENVYSGSLSDWTKLICVKILTRTIAEFDRHVTIVDDFVYSCYCALHSLVLLAVE